MVGCEMLDKISRTWTEAKGTATAFGGIVIRHEIDLCRGEKVCRLMG